MMLGFPPAGASPGSQGPNNPFGGFPGMEGAPPDDPMMQMLQQMLGGGGGGAGGMPNLESMMANGGSMPSFPGMPNLSPDPATADPYAYIWRIVHAVFAFGLGLYIAFTQTSFSGTKLARERSGIDAANIHNADDFSQGLDLNDVKIQIFWIFATAEVLLQTTRFFLEKGKMAQQPGMLGMVMGFLPEPWKGYVGTALRYGRIWTTVSGDAMVIVFVLGAVAWWKGM
jgi:hypothetical protein